MSERTHDVSLDDDMEAVVLAYRTALVAHCYRFLGSLHDAEEATQEAFVRAWQHREGFRGDSSTRTWLLSIATRVCLDLLRGRKRAIVPAAHRAAANPSQPFDDPLEDVAWLEPLPTVYLADSPADPASVYTAGESVRLAFVAALQTLTAQQRAVVILRDVLAFSAVETAATIGCSVGSVTSSLHRARVHLRRIHHDTGVASFPDSAIDDPEVARILESFVRAWQTSDVDALVTTLREDVRLAMPPVPSWYSGRDDVVTMIATSVLSQGRFELRPAFYNAQPSFTLAVTRPDGTTEELGEMVLTLDGSGISAIDVFQRP